MRDRTERGTLFLLILLIPFLLRIYSGESQKMEIMGSVCLVKGQGPHKEDLRAFGLSRFGLVKY